MPKKKPHRGYAAGRGSSSQNRPADINGPLARNQDRPAPALDLVGLRARLVGARRRLLERLAEDWPADRRFPDSAWTKLLADVHGAVQAVDAQVADDGGAP